MKKMKILMIEDDTNIISINREFFEAKDYEVFCALTLNHARFQLEECNPDLILLDVMMPDGSGYYFCTELRQKTNAPIIFLTCKDESENIVKGLFHGGDDYITKPYDLNVLNARVDTQLRRTRVMNDGKIAEAEELREQAQELMEQIKKLREQAQDFTKQAEELDKT